MRKIFFFFLLVLLSDKILSQDIVFKDVLKANRDKIYRNLINNTINKNLSLPLADSTEENWEDAFSAMELLNYRSPWADNKIREAVNNMQARNGSFQRSLLELIYTNYKNQFTQQVELLARQSNDIKIIAYAANYLLQSKDSIRVKDSLLSFIRNDISIDSHNNGVLLEFARQMAGKEVNEVMQSIHTFFEKDYLPKKVLMFSFQRQDRNFPGLVMVRDTSGNFVKDENGEYFSVPQLARSISGLPGYLTNGNTPEGIFRMDGFGNSKTSFIGPTTNIQLIMPFENMPSHFYNDSTLSDDQWDVWLYKDLLPVNFKEYMPLYQSYYAGRAGRTEIIAHGTTVNPEYYKGNPYYPLTPTLGCLCTKEIWDESTGKILVSDQQKLVNTVIKAGGPYGYAIVINIDDRKSPVTLNDIIPFLKLAGQN